MRRARRWVIGSVAGAGLAAAAVAVLSCGEGFDPISKVDSVRMFAVRADKPYAKPGEQVTLDVLMTDSRATKPRPLKLYWIPVVCMNPRDDLYYLCFIPPSAGIDGGATFALPEGLADAGIDAGAFGGGGADGGIAGGLFAIPPGTDLSPFLPQGPSFSFRMPDDAIQPRQGSDPYGIAILFNVACAGRIVLAARDPSGGPQQVPVQCVDENGNALPPSDYVIGISRVYSYTTRTNANPVIERVTKDGADVDTGAGITIDHCTTAKESCPNVKLDVHVSDASWEDTPEETGQDLHEEIWVDWYSDQGQLGSDARLLFDERKGRINDSAVDYHASQVPSDGTIWAVVHDNRGGVAWAVFPVHAK